MTENTIHLEHLTSGMVLLESCIGLLSRKVGNGRKIRLGIVPIAGMNSSYLLSEDLRGYLADYGITYLA